MTHLRQWLTPPVFIHVLLTFIMVWWCFILALPGDTFATSPAYAGFARIMPEDAWAFATGCVAVFAAGTNMIGTTGACTVVVTMNGATGMTAPNGWYCSASDRNTPANLQSTSASTTTTCTITGTTVSGDVVSFAATPY